VVTAKIGDRVVVEAEGTSRTPRHGVIEEILQEQPPRLRIQWDDGHESILSPAAGALRVEPGRKASASRKRASRKAAR
jgi:Domain of unknown function (DUF1918)